MNYLNVIGTGIPVVKGPCLGPRGLTAEALEVFPVVFLLLFVSLMEQETGPTIIQDS